MNSSAPTNTTSGAPTIAIPQISDRRGPSNSPASARLRSSAAEQIVTRRNDRLQGAENSAMARPMGAWPAREGSVFLKHRSDITIAGAGTYSETALRQGTAERFHAQRTRHKSSNPPPGGP